MQADANHPSPRPRTYYVVGQAESHSECEGVSGGGVGGGRGGQAWKYYRGPSLLAVHLAVHGQQSQPATRPTGRGARTLEGKKRPLGFSKAPTLDVGGSP